MENERSGISIVCREICKNTGEIAAYLCKKDVDDQDLFLVSLRSRANPELTYYAILYDWIFQKYAEPGFKILDTHLGSGSSRIAAYEAGLDFIGFEIDPTMFAAEEQRFADHTAQQSLFHQSGLFINGG